LIIYYWWFIVKRNLKSAFAGPNAEPENLSITDNASPLYAEGYEQKTPNGAKKKTFSCQTSILNMSIFLRKVR
jgi:hypothetical protein